MGKKAILSFILLLCLCSALLYGCKTDEAASTSRSGTGKSEADNSGPVRDNTPNVLVPEASGTVTYGNDIITLDASHTDQGYLMLQYTGSNSKVKLQIAAPDSTTYTYLLSQTQQFETFPFTAGNGSYALSVLENVEDDLYTVAFSQTVDVNIANEFTPFLYPNQYVYFAADSNIVSKGKELAEGAHSDLEVVENIYHYVINNVSYDSEKASSVSYGYLPNVDETLSTGKGICFDYAAILCSMLRTQNIPTKLDIGYAGEVYHAWISTYVDDKGWIDNIIEFSGSSWELMDPTFAANSSDKSLKDFIGNGENYLIKYSY